ncbi:MAG: DNA polymerase/3'-5' exonuclease PolX [Candidatus Methanospirare jalkutatii]|nr:DNA polymerase/3'-5' exonuclease PolX [Candidatus Methanospirare jalkutatii]
MINLDIARIFDEIADLSEIKGENPFRVRAYRRAARTIETLTLDLRSIVERSKSEADAVRELTKIPGIGEGIAKKIYEIVKTGRSSKLESLRSEVNPSLVELLKIPHVGPKTIAKVHKELGISTIEELEEAARRHKLARIAGLGRKAEEKILKGIEQYRKQKGRVPIAKALPYAEAIVEALKSLKSVRKIVIAGSLRRWKDTIGDIDILVVSENPSEVMDAFTRLDGVEEVLAKGETKSSVIFRGINADLRVVPPESFGAATHYFTGSKQHNIRIRELGVKKGLKINEYGIFRGEERIGGEQEEDVFAAVNLPFIPPELREDWGEIEAAQTRKLPKLIEMKDLKGDLHVHTNYSDGKNSIEEMAKAAISLGYEYIAVADHSKAVGIAGGMDEEKLRKRQKEIERLNERFESAGINFRVLSAVEVDIKSDFKLDFSDEILRDLDVVIAAIHSKFSQDSETMTKRIISAIENPYVDIIAHPTGRILGKREAYSLDIERVMDAAHDNGVVLELNSYPDRLDLRDIHCKMAKERGVKIAISTDAHDAVQMREVIRYGIATARRGWLSPEDVVNTRSLREMLSMLKHKH